MEKNVSLIYFSATKGTQKIVRTIAKGMGLAAQEYDFTRLSAPPETPDFGSDDLVIIGAPVYVGRVPMFVNRFLQSVNANETPCVLIGLYGNRNYDDYLVELEDIVRERGFLPVAAAAFIGEHSFSDKLAGGRPSAEDLELAEDFGKKIIAKISTADSTPVLSENAIPGNRPYRDPFVKGNMPLAPVVNENCISCGACASACPSGAIDPQDVHNINAEKCLKCRACAHGCPSKAIDFTDKMFWGHVEQLVGAFGSPYKTPEIVI